MLLESCLWLTAKILVKWVIFADVTLAICMDLVMSYGTCLQHWYVSVLGAVHWWWSFLPIFVLFDSWYGLMGGTVKWLIVWGVTAPWEIMLCSWVFWFAVPWWTWWSATLAVEFYIHDFKHCCSSTWILFKNILRVYPLISYGQGDYSDLSGFIKVESLGYFVKTFLIINFIGVQIKNNVVNHHSPTHLLNTEDVFWRNVGAQTSHTRPCVLSHGLKFCVLFLWT
jgi:hypothetical protein